MLRLPLVVLCVVFCAHSLFAGKAFTIHEIALMLRSGYSSKAILADLETRHFAGTLNADNEKGLLGLHASPELILALKNSQNAASQKEMIETIEASNRQADEAKRMTGFALERQAAEQRSRAERTGQITIAPASAQHVPEVLMPSEIEAAKKAEKLAKIEARKQYCEEHPVECETLRAAKAAQSDADQARRDLDSLKHDLSMQRSRDLNERR